MRNTKKKIREAYYNALSGSITLNGAPVPVVSGFTNAENILANHIIIDEMNETEKDSTQQSWGNETIVQLQLVSFALNSVSFDDLDEMEDQILQILFPTQKTVGISVTGFELLNLTKDSSNDIVEQDEAGSVVRRIIRFRQDIRQF